MNKQQIEIAEHMSVIPTFPTATASQLHDTTKQLRKRTTTEANYGLHDTFQESASVAVC